jgi:hypothetical protein
MPGSAHHAVYQGFWPFAKIAFTLFRDAQDNKVPITIALIGALLRECTLQ